MPAQLGETVGQRFSVAIVHDYLTQRGGAERVVLWMTRAFPGTKVYTALYEPATTFPDFDDVPIEASILNRIALLRRHHRLALPLLATAFSSMTVDADVVICSSSGWAHGVRATGRKIVYCHAPARWLYQSPRYAADSLSRKLAVAVLGGTLKRWDRRAAGTADRYIANSTVVRDRIRAAYGIEATVVPPPTGMDPSGPQRKVDGFEGGYYLCVSRLLEYKNVGEVVTAFSDLPNRHLVLVGTGPAEARLKDQAPANVSFLGTVADAELRWLYGHARALVSASHEDFGLTPLEAAAFGVPAVVLGAGGFLDTVVDGRTGTFFDVAERTAIRDAILRFEAQRLSADAIRAQAESFSFDRFQQRLWAIAEEEATLFRKQP